MTSSLSFILYKRLAITLMTNGKISNFKIIIRDILLSNKLVNSITQFVNYRLINKTLLTIVSNKDR